MLAITRARVTSLPPGPLRAAINRPWRAQQLGHGRRGALTIMDPSVPHQPLRRHSCGGGGHREATARCQRQVQSRGRTIRRLLHSCHLLQEVSKSRLPHRGQSPDPACQRSRRRAAALSVKAFLKPGHHSRSSSGAWVGASAKRSCSHSSNRAAKAASLKKSRQTQGGCDPPPRAPWAASARSPADDPRP
jgi:hypothetical protein